MSDVKKAIAMIKNGEGVGAVLTSLLGQEIQEGDNGQDVHMTLSLFIRMMEWAREAAKTDGDTHKVAEAVYSHCHADEDDAVTVRAADYDTIIKAAKEDTGGGFAGDAAAGTYGPSKSYPSKKKGKKGDKKKVKEATEQPILTEYGGWGGGWSGEASCIRLEMDCFEHILVHAGMKAKKAKALANAVARQCIGMYGALSKEGFTKALEHLSESSTKPSVLERYSRATAIDEDEEPPRIRIEMGCLEHGLELAGKEKWNKKKVLEVTKSIARFMIGSYESLTKVELDRVLSGVLETVTEKELTTKARKKLAPGTFVFPKERRYPIQDLAHARNALARVAQHGSPSEKAAVQRAVASRFPQLKKSKGKK